MLLNHSFVGGLVEDDAEIEEGGILAADDFGLSLTVCETDEECSYSSFSYDGSFGSEDEFFLLSCSEEGGEVDSGEFSSFVEEGILEGQESVDTTSSTIDLSLVEVKDTPEKVSTNTVPQCPIAFTIPAESPHNLLMMADHYARPRSSRPPTPKVSPPTHQVARLDHSLSGSSLPPNLLSAASS